MANELNGTMKKQMELEMLKRDLMLCIGTSKGTAEKVIMGKNKNDLIRTGKKSQLIKEKERKG